MERLTKVSDWETKYQTRLPGTDAGTSPLRGLAQLGAAFGPKRPAIEPRTFSDRCLWDIYARHLPTGSGLRLLEIGSAPGNHLVALHRRFGFIPYGVEYTESGVALNRDLFIRNALPPTNVIHSDVFSPGFQSEYREFFDVVLSRGFIEHFEDPREAVRSHLALLKPGGTMVVMIPNLTGINATLTRFFAKATLRQHNLTIMRLDRFREVFDLTGLEERYCSYYGIFDFDLFDADRKGVRDVIRRAGKGGQLFLNVLFHMLFRHGGPQHPAVSPYLVFVGIKREP